MNCPENLPVTQCLPCTGQDESVASMINNLTLSLFGEFTKTIVNGRTVWENLCDPDTIQLSCFPRNEGEGFICYFQRWIGELGTSWEGSWDSGTSYCKGSLVTFDDIIYIALQETLNEQPDVTPLAWDMFAQGGSVGPQGPAGPQGPPGTSGGGSAINYSTLITSSNYTLTNLDALIWCANAGSIVLTIPAMSTLSVGKWFIIEQRGVGQITIQSSGSNTFNGASTYVLGTQYSRIQLTSVNNGDWAAG